MIGPRICLACQSQVCEMQHKSMAERREGGGVWSGRDVSWGSLVSKSALYNSQLLPAITLMLKVLFGATL